MTDYRRILDQVLDADFVESVKEKSAEELKVSQHEIQTVENEFSYLRRLAHARMEILDAELDRRQAGRSLGDLIADLPSILGGDQGNRDPANTRLPHVFTPAMDLRLESGLEHLVSDATLAKLPMLKDSEIATTKAELQEFEVQVSERRQALHLAIDAVQAELRTRTTP